MSQHAHRASGTSAQRGTSRAFGLLRPLLVLGKLALLVTLSISGGCTDPVRDAQIQALGDETGPIGPDHRPGQPCVLCHSAGGPASNKPFALAGTIYKNATDDTGAKDITVQFVDARGQGPFQLPLPTSDSGNFYVPLEDWPKLAFPVRVALYTDPNKAPVQTMKSLIGREGSCNYCHRPNVIPEAGGKLSKEDANDARDSVGQIYVGGT